MKQFGDGISDFTSHSEDVVYEEKHLSRVSDAATISPAASISASASRSMGVKS